ncbi:MAG: hypothetical protein U0984_08035 [Prosthecobacter sp.]|nr:hypothetical protein [Prosthecobacter sp.]
MKATFRAAEPLPAEAPRARKARAFTRPGRLVLVALLLFGAFVGSVAFGLGLIGMIATGTQEAGILALSGLGAFATGKIGAFALSRSLVCSLCHGTVMHEKRCQKHAQAFRIRPLSHRASAAAAILTTGTFRCMYCGTPYRLKR